MTNSQNMKETAVVDAPNKDNTQQEKSSRPACALLLKAALPLSLAFGGGVGIGFAVCSGSEGLSLCADSEADTSSALIREYISQQVTTKCDTKALATNEGFAECRDFCAPAAAFCFSADGDGPVKAKARGTNRGGGWNLDACTEEAAAGVSGSSISIGRGVIGGRHGGSSGWSPGVRRFLGASGAGSGSNPGGEKAHSPCLTQELCYAYEGCDFLYMDLEDKSKKNTSNSSNGGSGEGNDIFDSKDAAYQDSYAATQSEARAKCHTQALLWTDGVEACLEICAPAFDAGCFAVDVTAEDGDLHQEGQRRIQNKAEPTYPNARGRGEIDSRPDKGYNGHGGGDGEGKDRHNICGAYAVCRTLLYVNGNNGFRGEEVLAMAAVDAACDGTDHRSCQDVCDAAECCFAGWDLLSSGGRRALETEMEGGDSSLEDRLDDAGVMGDECIVAGLSGLQCEHYLSCAVLLDGMEEAILEGKGLSHGP